MIVKNSVTHTAWGALCLAMLFACNNAAVDAVDEEQQQLRKTGYAVLSPAEFQTYSADRKYLRSLTKPNRPIRLNLADERQYRFVHTRLRLAGKTPKNSPYLFETIENRRKQHLATGVTEGLLPGASYTLSMDGARNDTHDMIGVTTIVDGNADQGHAATVASDVLPDLGATTPYLYTDISYTSTTGTPLAPFDFYEDFDAGAISSIETIADLTLTNATVYVADSYHAYEDENGDFKDTYTYSEVGAEDRGGRGGAELELGPVADILPKDKNADGDILICLSRTNEDCDENLLGMWEVKLPLRGSIVVTNDHYFSPADITDIQQELAADGNAEGYGSLSLMLNGHGGGCQGLNGDTLQPSMKQFWDNVTVSADGRSMSWDLTGANLAIFHHSCQLNYNSVILTLDLLVPTRDAAGQPHETFMTLTNNQALNTGVLHHYLPMRMKNSCLAAGTMIELPSGKTTPIESVVTGDRVFNRFHADTQALTVMDVAVGTEPKLMYRLEAEGGRTVLMTEMHPVQTPDRGMVVAKNLREEDVVMTKEGPRKLTSVTLESYDGKVYNLKIGSESELAALSEDQSMFYANGFLVGDLKVQSKHELLETTPDTSEEILKRLPARWHKDYLNAMASK